MVSTFFSTNRIAQRKRCGKQGHIFEHTAWKPNKNPQILTHCVFSLKRYTWLVFFKGVWSWVFIHSDSIYWSTTWLGRNLDFPAEFTNNNPMQVSIVCVTQQSFERSSLTVGQKLASNTYIVVHKAFVWYCSKFFRRTSLLHLSQAQKSPFCCLILSSELLPAPRRGQSRCWPPDPENLKKIKT